MQKATATKALIHFAHANGFPAQSYHKLFSHIDSDFELIALDKFAHNPRFPLNNNWQNQVDELIDFVHKKRHERDLALPVFLIGHSFGAVISYLAACKEPSMFDGLIMLDPPLVTGPARWLFRFAKSNQLIDKITPAGKTKIRNTKWHHDTDLVEYFSQRALFKDMDKACIKDYVNAATERKGDYLHLTFDEEVEANIFRTLPDNLHKNYGKLTIPGFLLTGAHTKVCMPQFRKRFLKGNDSLEHKALSFGGHMFPLEHPLQVAQAINQALKCLLKL